MFVQQEQSKGEAALEGSRSKRRGFSLLYVRRSYFPAVQVEP